MMQALRTCRQAPLQAQQQQALPPLYLKWRLCQRASWIALQHSSKPYPPHQASRAPASTMAL
jgi:hypothetical protein